MTSEGPGPHCCEVSGEELWGPGYTTSYLCLESWKRSFFLCPLRNLQNGRIEDMGDTCSYPDMGWIEKQCCVLLREWELLGPRHAH